MSLIKTADNEKEIEIPENNHIEQSFHSKKLHLCFIKN